MTDYRANLLDCLKQWVEFVQAEPTLRPAFQDLFQPAIVDSGVEASADLDILAEQVRQQIENASKAQVKAYALKFNEVLATSDEP